MNEPVRQLLFTKPRNSLNRIENYNSKVVYGAGICSLNHGNLLNQDSLNQDLSVQSRQLHSKACPMTQV